MRISDWSSDVCSSDLPQKRRCQLEDRVHPVANHPDSRRMTMKRWFSRMGITLLFAALFAPAAMAANALDVYSDPSCGCRSEEHTSELQSLMRISYAVFCLKKKKYANDNKHEEPEYNTRLL